MYVHIFLVIELSQYEMVWNSLPNIIVIAESTNIFKNRLDRFWINEEIKFDWHADIAGIGSRSVNS